VRNRRTDEFAKSVDLGFGLLQFFVCKKKTKKLEWMLYLFIEKKVVPRIPSTVVRFC
jgi:hypothetical protein